MMQRRPNPTKLRSMDSSIQILCRFQKCEQKVPLTSLLNIKKSPPVNVLLCNFKNLWLHFVPFSFFFSFFFKRKLPILSLESATDQRPFVITTFHGTFFLIPNFINTGDPRLMRISLLQISLLQFFQNFPEKFCIF